MTALRPQGWRIPDAPGGNPGARLALALCALALAAAALAIGGALAAEARADVEICSQGSGPGQCLDPEGVAADSSEGDGSGQIYVAEAGTDRVSVFEADGSFLFSFGGQGGAAGQFLNPRSIAVDNIVGSPGRHRVYVYDGANFRLQAFDHEGNFVWMAGKEVNTGNSGNANLCTNAGAPGEVCKAGVAGTGPGEFNSSADLVAVGPGGTVYVGDALSSTESRVEKFDEEGGFIEEVTLDHPDRLNQGLAVDSGGAIYAAFNAGGGIFKFKADGSEDESPYPLDPGTETTSLGVDGDDNLYAGQREEDTKPGSGGFYRIITVYDAAGANLGRFGYGRPSQRIRGVATLSSGLGEVLVAESSISATGDAVSYLMLPGPLGEMGPITAPPSVLAPPAQVSNTKAVLEAEINPEGKSTDYRFEYVDKESFDSEGGFASPNTRETPEKELAGGAEDFNLHFVEEQIGCDDPVTEASEEGKCLRPETTYVFRTIAENVDGEGESEVQGEFETKAAVEHLATYATEPGSDTMRLNVRVNPLGVPASGYFEYVEESIYEESDFEEAIQVPDVEGGQSPLDFGGGEAPVTRGATIFPLEPGTAYRYRAVLTGPLIEPTPGPERSFTAFREATIDADCANAALRQGAGENLPDCRAYELVSPLDKEGGDVVTLEEPVDHVPAELDRASLDGQRLTYSAYRAFAEPEGAPNISQYLAERDPESGWANAALAAPRENPLLPPQNLLDTEFKAASADLCSFWFRSVYEPPLAEGAIAKYPNLYRRDVDADGCARPPGYTAITTATPGHESTDNEAFPGEHYFSLELQGTSADGSKAIYAVTDNLTPQAPNLEGDDLALYEWEEGEPLRYACILPGAGGPFGGGCSGGRSAVAPIPNGRAHSNSLAGAISSEGSHVYWTAAGGNGTGSGPIYVRVGGTETLAVSAAAEEEEAVSASTFELAAADGSRAVFETGGTLYEFSIAGKATEPIAPSYLGMLGASEDASRVYVASEADLGGEAVAGEPNLYLHEAGAPPRYIATLADADLPTAFGPSPLEREPIRQIARVSPDGRHAAFNSLAALSGYDNADAASEEAAAEVFRYDAEAGEGAGELLCVSCNPSGARPVGENVARVFGALVDKYNAAAYLPSFENDLYGPRALSDDGSRVYFQAADALVARDSNGAQDVYQWEAEGAGGCEKSDPGFAAEAGGCIDLISSGQGSAKAAIVDASPSGEDVFFSTLASLVGPDYGLVDIYDARVGGGFPEPPPPRPECEGEACQSPAAAPQASVPASFLYSGPGNLAARASASRCNRSARRAKALSRRAKRLRAKAKRAEAPAAKRKRLRAAGRAAKGARRQSRSAKRCRARARRGGRAR